MTVRDLGYRAYEGELRAPSQNYWVMMRHGLWRIWSSWINKFVVFFFWVPLLVLGLMALARSYMPIPEDAAAHATGVQAWFVGPPAVWLRTLTGIQFWFFASIVTVRSGANVISEDLSNRAYQFYFAKPLTPIQYLLGRTGALAIWIFGLIFVPSAVMIVIFMVLGPRDEVLERLGLFLPALLDATLVAASTSTLAIATSALSKSRALTLTAWALLLFVPFALAFLVQGIGDVEWVFAISLPGALWSVGDAIYKVSGTWDHLEWFHSAPVLLVAVVGGAYAARRRLQGAEVIT